jgi:hypothetical protein
VPSIFWKNDAPLLHDGMAAAMMFGIGFAPISALALALMGICSLPFATLMMVVPALVSAIGLSSSLISILARRILDWFQRCWHQQR